MRAGRAAARRAHRPPRTAPGPRPDIAWALLAGAGVVLLGSPTADVDPTGALLAFGSAASWAAYIPLAKRMVGAAEPLPVLTGTLVVAAVLLTAPATAMAGPAPWDGRVLAVALAVAALASAIPTCSSCWRCGWSVPPRSACCSASSPRSRR
jgi:threonine/homoserine efflux transporter RhtA